MRIALRGLARVLLASGRAAGWATRRDAYLAVGRAPEATPAYLDLYAATPAVAGKLLAAMKRWVADQRANASGSNASNPDELHKWIQEPAQIAGHTAALTRAGTAAS